MTDITREFSLYLDGDLPGGAASLLEAKTSNGRQAVPRWMAGDKFDLKLFFRRRGEPGESSAPLELPAASTVVLAGKPAADLADGDILFSCASFAQTGSGDDVCYLGEIDLNTDELDSALEAAVTDELEVAVDVEVRDATNTERVTYRFTVYLVRQVYADEGAPTPGAPLYALMAVGTVNLVNGQEYIAVTGLALPSLPLQILLSVRKPAADDLNLAPTIREDSISTDGFTADLTAAPDKDGYKLDYLIIRGVA